MALAGAVMLLGGGLGCAGLIPGLGGGGGGTVRVQNATVATPICKVVIGHRKTLRSYEQRLEPGASADLAASDPGSGEPQQPVKLVPCEGATFMTENITFAQGKKHLVVLFDGADPPALETPVGFARYDLRNSRDGSRLVNLPQWQDEKGMKADWYFFSLRSRCDHSLDYKVTPGTKAPSIIEPIPAAGHKFWSHGSTYAEIGEHSKEPITLWLRDNKKGGGVWIEAHQLQPGASARLEVDRSCKKIVERADDERYHGCYEWAYSPACQLASRVSLQPEGCPAGTPSVEGDMSRVCEIQTDKGLCTVRYAQKAAGCDVR